MTKLRPSVAFGLGRDLALAVVACAALLVLSLPVQLAATERELREHSLERAARYIEQNLRFDPNGSPYLPSLPPNSWASSGYPVLVFDRQGRPLLQRPADLQPAVVEALFRQGTAAEGRPHPAGAPRFFTVAVGNSRIIGAALRSGADERLITVFKDDNAPDVLTDFRQFSYRRVWTQLLILGLLLVAGAWIVRRRMQPIAEASRIAGAIGPHTLDLRLPERGLPAEVQPIVRAVNAAFERLDRAAAEQREFLRRAAHQLRTPLTVLSARAGLLGDDATATQLRADVAEIARIVTQLLQLNEVESLPERAEAMADLGAVGEAVRDELAAAAAARGIRIDLVQPPNPVLVRGDANVIEIAVRNLVENAVHHSRARSAVVIRVEAEGILEIVDAGPGIPEQLREKIFEPFWSGDPNGGRAGLGLTIVRSVAERCGAETAVRSGPGGGASFALRFRKASVSLDELDPLAAQRSVPVSLAQRRQQQQAFERAMG